MPSHPLPPELVPPLDFSFQPLQSLQDLCPDAAPSPTVAVRFPYTGLRSLAGLHPTLQRLLLHPARLRWLDLACNRLSCIEPVLSTLLGLQSLNLHGNNIRDLSEVQKLRPLSELRRLTLNGNPMEEEPGYRRYVLAALPQLNSLDFSAVTEQERRDAAVWGRAQGRNRPHREQ
ncbi:leucine-rich repeat-containing protein 51-like [Coturnix japonica]|uniref:Leucine-rich repeat-containing protein 51 n=1 Tax=Coturnix japonica TaxID=93934 RepID=A0A8C2SYA0_COTJA|nr:leucine-rich repeat-containing protein 51-like [Coturnix japonica]